MEELIVLVIVLVWIEQRATSLHAQCDCGDSVDSANNRRPSRQPWPLATDPGARAFQNRLDCRVSNVDELPCKCDSCSIRLQPPPRSITTSSNTQENESVRMKPTRSGVNSGRLTLAER